MSPEKGPKELVFPPHYAYGFHLLIIIAKSMRPHRLGQAKLSDFKVVS
jgi:hypothetical protein